MTVTVWANGPSALHRQIRELEKEGFETLQVQSPVTDRWDVFWAVLKRTDAVAHQ